MNCTYVEMVVSAATQDHGGKKCGLWRIHDFTVAKLWRQFRQLPTPVKPASSAVTFASSLPRLPSELDIIVRKRVLISLIVTVVSGGLWWNVHCSGSFPTTNTTEPIKYTLTTVHLPSSLKVETCVFVSRQSYTM